MQKTTWPRVLTAIALLAFSSAGAAAFAWNRAKVADCEQSSMWFVDFAPPGTGSEPSVPGALAPIVAVLDGAIDRDHFAIRGVLRGGGDVLAASVASSAAGSLHATAVASVLAASDPTFWIAPWRVLDDRCTGSLSNIVAGIRLAVDEGATVLLLPFASEVGTRELRQALAYAVARDAVVVAAAGNDGDMNVSGAIHDEGILVIGAVDDYGVPAAFTTTSPHIDISDRGVGIEVAWADGGRGRASGTSFAAAHTAAAAAALRAEWPGLPAAAIIRALVESADPIVTADENERIKLGGITNLAAARRLLAGE